MRVLVYCIILSLFSVSSIVGQNISWEINDMNSWENFTQESSNLEISQTGLTTPINQSADYSFKSKIISFSEPVSAHDITFKQSPVWDNWDPISNVGPDRDLDAPILISVKKGEYYLLGLGTSGGYHAYESNDMISWTDRGAVTGDTNLTGRWTTSAEYKNGQFYIYYDSPNDQDPHLFIDDNLRDGIIGQDIGLVFDDPSYGSDCSVFRDDFDGLFHIIHEDWSPINAQTHSWDSPLAGHTSSENGITGFTPNEYVPVIDDRTNPTGVIDSFSHPFVDYNMEYEIHQPEQNAYGDYTTIKVGSQYYIFSDYEPVGQSIRSARFTSNALNQEFDLVGSLGSGHPDPTVGFAEEKFYLITQQNTDYTSTGPWVDGVSARCGVDVDGDGIIDSWTPMQEIKESYDHKSGYIRIVTVDDAKIDLSSLPSGYGFQFEFIVDNMSVPNVSPLMNSVRMRFWGNAPSGVNVALNKPSGQSTTDFDGVSSLAVDGNTNGVYFDGSVTHTQRVGSTDPWWRVDLGDNYDIDDISIYNRTDLPYNGRLNGAKVFIGNIDSTNPEDYTEVGTLTSSLIQHMSGIDVSGQYVMVHIPGNDRILSLAEVEVYGTLSQDPEPNPQCTGNEVVYDFEANIDPWQSINTYSFNQSFTSNESNQSLFFKIDFEEATQGSRGGSFTNFNNAVQNWSNFTGLEFDFIFVNVSNDPTAAGRPPSRAAGSREVYLELEDSSGKIIRNYFSDTGNSWHQRRANWTDFVGDAGFNLANIKKMGFYTDRSGQDYTEVIRFDDIDLICVCDQDNLIYDFEDSILPWTSSETWSFGQSGTSFESQKSVFVKASFDSNSPSTRAGSSSPINGNTQNWSSYKGIWFDFIFVNVASDPSTVGRPPSRAAGTREVYLELADSNGRTARHYFVDSSNTWHQRKVYWSDFNEQSGFNRAAIETMGFYVEKNGQVFTEVFRFDDIELICKCDEFLVEMNQPIINYNKLIDQNIVTNGVVISGESVMYKAGSQLNFVEGFEVQSGSAFAAELGACEE